MSKRRARILFAAGVSSSVLAGLAVSGSSGATTPDPVTESSEIITDTIGESGVTTTPGSTLAVEPQPSCRSAATGPVEGPSHPGDRVADPAGRIAYAVVGRFDDAFGPIGTQLYAVDPDGSDRVLLLDCDVIRPQWSPDGSRLAFTIGLEDGSWQVATIAADGSDLRLVTSGPGIHEIPSWSPDGTWLAYDSSDVGLDDPTFRATLWRIGADGSDAALLGDPDSFDVEPRLSPDGGQVAFMRLHPEADFAVEIVVRDLVSGDERVVVPLEVPVEHPEWSPDGNSLVFNAQDGAPDATTIYTIDLAAPDAAPVVLLDPATGDGWGGVKPVYSPDGSHIVFVCVHAGEEGICTMDADGTNVTPLVDDPGVAENHPTWGAAAP